MNKMKLAVVGATGIIGQRIVKEALERGHEVTALVRDESRITEKHQQLQATVTDIFKADSIEKAAKGHDVLISAFGPVNGQEQTLVDATKALLEFSKQSGVRIIAVGGAGSLEAAPGLQIVDLPEFPAAYKPAALAHREALGLYTRSTGVNWTNFSPAANIQPGERTGKYRLGTNQLVTDEHGKSDISAEDYAVALLDEVEKPQFLGKRFTAAY